jgi:L-malate glycosyltransferase
MMKVAHVAHSADRGILGVETHILTLATAQKERGFSPMVITDRPGYLSEACDQRGIPMAVEQGLKLPASGQGVSPGRTIESLIAIFASFGADVIHCHTLPAASQAIVAADRIHIPCIYTHHLAAGGLPMGAAQMLGLRFTIISVSKIGLEYLRKGGVPEKRLYYVPNGTKPVPAERPIERKSHRPDLILVGSMNYTKGVDIAILAIHELRMRRGQACPILNIYGAGPREKYFKEMTALLDLDDIVLFHGVQAGILERCASTDILIVPSRDESGPVVVLEAMSRGMPIVVSEVGEATEMLPDPRYGRIIPVNSITALADAVESMLSDIANGQFDSELLIARHRALYTADKMAERIEPIYENALLT